MKWVQTFMTPRGIHSTDFGDPITFPVGSHQVYFILFF